MKGSAKRLRPANKITTLIQGLATTVAEMINVNEVAAFDEVVDWSGDGGRFFVLEEHKELKCRTHSLL